MHIQRLFRIGVVIFGVIAGFQARASEPTVLYATTFESSEGYDINNDLIGQNGWTGEGSSSPYWNGLIDEVFAGFGQQAYVGYATLPDRPGFLSVWKPNLPAVPVNQPLVKFSVLMAVLDSTAENGHYDDFRWSVYTASAQRLFTLDFDNYALNVNYALDDGNGFVGTGKSFEPNHIYELVITMDMSRNVWSARIDDTALVTEQPITTIGTPLTLGDIDAVWAIHDANNPGDNFMAFDNYSVEAYANAIPPELQTVSHLSDGSNLLRLQGEPNRTYVIEVTTNFLDWSPIKTNTPPDGIFEYLDTAAIGEPVRFYRARTN